MNLVGKIFIILISVMALFFMALTMALSTSQRNWRDEVLRPQEQVTPNKELGLKYRLEAKNRESTELKDEKDKLEKAYATEKVALQQQLSKLDKLTNNNWSDYDIRRPWPNANTTRWIQTTVWWPQNWKIVGRRLSLR